MFDFVFGFGRKHESRSMNTTLNRQDLLLIHCNIVHTETFYKNVNTEQPVQINLRKTVILKLQPDFWKQFIRSYQEFWFLQLTFDFPNICKIPVPLDFIGSKYILFSSFFIVSPKMALDKSSKKLKTRSLFLVLFSKFLDVYGFNHGF